MATTYEYITVEPTVEPVTTAEVKDNSRIFISDDDTLIESLIIAARQYCENYCDSGFVEQTWIQKRKDFPSGDDSIVLEHGPVISVTDPIDYVDSDGSDATFVKTDNWFESSDGRYRTIHTEYSIDWPTARIYQDAVTVTFVVGYGTLASDVPQAIRQAILLLVGHWYENREASTTQVAIPRTMKETIYNLLNPYRYQRTA